MGVRIWNMPIGITQCYLIQGEQTDGVIMIDTGVAGKIGRFKKGMSKIPLSHDAIKLIVVTHGHFDHVGCARELKALTGAPIAMHPADQQALEEGQTKECPGVTLWGRMLKAVFGLYKPMLKVPATPVDIVVEGEHNLAEFGIPGRIVHTPGHTPGSCSVLLESGDAFVGDLAMRGMPLRFGAGLPIFAEDLPQVRQSWKKLLELGAKKIHPGHGAAFPAEVMREQLDRS